jgi:hypothetical protein
LTKSIDRSYGYSRAGSQPRPRGRPLYKAIFSFVFGDGDPNADWPSREKQAVIAYIQANSGVISLPEYMALTGMESAAAEEGITGFCAEFGGLPEATDDGTVVYRFDELLLRADKKNRSFAGFTAPLKRLRSFSSNKKKMNGWFSAINGVNLVFGSYFLFNAFTTGAITTQAQFDAASYLYKVSYLLFSSISSGDILPFITIGLGVVPLVFSILFWLIPLLRNVNLKKANETVKLENLRKDGFHRIWEAPLSVKPAEIDPKPAECRPKNMAAARDRVIKEIGVYSVPEVALDTAGEAVYSFNELEREKTALEKYRRGINPDASGLGKVVFDSEG